jgi:hypothetical protein
MDIRMMRKPFLSTVRATIAMAGLLGVGMATPARADLQIQLSLDGSSWTTEAEGSSGTAVSYGYPSAETLGAFTIQTLSTASNSPGSSVQSVLFGSDTFIKNTGSTTATLYITMSDTGFKMPYSPVTVDSHVGGTVITPGSGNLMTYQSYIDPANGQNTTTGYSPGPQDSKNGLTIKSGSFDNDAYLTLAKNLSSQYSVTEYFKITLSAGSEINFSSSTTLTTPEPSSLVLAGLGGISVVGFALRRRRTMA